MENLEDVIKKLEPLVGTKVLKDKDLIATPIVLETEKSYGIDNDEVTFSITFPGSFEVQLFNDQDDKDEDKLVSTKPDTLVQFNPASEAVLKYTAAVKPKANGQVSLEDIGFSFKLDASATLKAVYARSHNNNEVIRDAFIGDVRRFLTVFKWADVEKLSVGDALSFIVNGSLNSEFKMSWSDVFSKGLSGIVTVLQVPLTLDLSFTPELAASFALKIEDQFSYAIKKISTTECEISVSKSKSSDMTAGVGASISVGFAKSDQLQKDLNSVLDKIVQSIFKLSIKDIDDAIEEIKNGSSEEKWKKIIEKVAQVLNLVGGPDIIDIIETKWKELKDDAAKGIEKIATLNAKLSLSYEYHRTKKGKELLSMTIPTTALQQHHGKLLQFRLGSILDAYRAGIPGAQLKSYLNQTSLTIEKSFTLGLTIFNFSLLSGNINKYSENIDQDIQKHRMMSLSKTRGYKWKLGKGNGFWLGEMDLSMKSYSAATEPRYSEVDLSLLVNTYNEDHNVSDDELRAYLDLGVLWGAINEADIDPLTQKYLPLLRGQRTLFESKIIVSDLAMKAVLLQGGMHDVDPVNIQLMARSFAAALPYNKDFPIRRSVALREEVYWKLWVDVLVSPGASAAALAQAAYDAIRVRPDRGELHNWE